MPANSLIDKSIWHGTINSWQEGPCIGTHPALPNPTAFMLRTRGRFDFPPHQESSQPGAGPQAPKHAL